MPTLSSSTRRAGQFFMFFMAMLACTSSALAQAQLWTRTTANSVWSATSNWNTNVPTTSQYAQFADAGLATTYFISTNYTLQGIEVTNARTRTITINNTSGNSRTFTLTGGSINGVANTILRNGSGFDLTLSSTPDPLTLALGNTTANKIYVDGAGSIDLSAVAITGAADKPLQIFGAGTGLLLITGSKTFAGKTTLFGATTSVDGESAFGTAPVSFTADQITFNGGTLNTFGNINFSSTRGITLAAGGGVFEANTGLTITLSNIVAGAGALTKKGVGTLLFNAAHTYTGGTVVQAGTASLSAANRLADAGPLTMAGGTFSTGATTGFAETMGTLTVTAASTLALGTGSYNINFATSNGTTWTGGPLTITGWTGAYNGTAGTGPRVFVGSTAAALTAGQLAQIQFLNGGFNYPAIQLSTGEVVANAFTPPTVTTTTPAGSITSVAASLPGGNVTAAGSYTVTARGIVYGTVAAPTGNATTNGTGTGTFGPVAISGLAPNTLYYYRAYATNASGTAYGADGTFTTLATVTTTTPATLITDVAASLPGGNVTSTGTVTARGIVYGTTANPTGNATSNGTAAGTFGPVAISSLTPNTLYYYRAYATNAGGTAYGADGTFTTLISTNSDIIVDAAYTYNATHDYTLYQSASITSIGTGAGGSADILRFDVRDGGGAADGDALPTILSGITFTSVQGIANIRQAALFNGTTLVAQASSIDVSGGNIVFTGLSGANVTAPDNGSRTLTLAVSFKASVTDNQFIVVSAANTSVTAAAGTTSSTFKTFSLTSNSARNRVVVTASRIAFITQPIGYVGVSSNFTVSVQAIDGLGSRDLDQAGTIAITRTAGTGTLSGTTTGTMAAGLFATTNLQLNVIETGVVLQATIAPSLTPGPSLLATASFEVTSILYTTGDYRTKLGGTADWGTAANWEILQADGSWATSAQAPDATITKVHVERSMGLPAYSGTGGNSLWTIHTLYIKGSSTVFNTSPTGTSPGLDIISGELRIAAGARLQADGQIFLRASLGSTAAAPATLLTVDSLATLVINYAADNQALLWNGTENFKGGSILEVQKWATAATTPADRLLDPAAARTVSLNAKGYAFGNVTINITAAVSGSEVLTLLHGSSAYKFCKNTLKLQANQRAGTEYTIVGNRALGAVTYGNVYTTGGALFHLYNSTSTGTMTASIERDLLLDGTSQLDINGTSAPTTAATLSLGGNYISSATSKVIATDGGSTIQLAGAATHLIAQASTSPVANTNVAWIVSTGETAQLQNNWAFGDNAALTVKSGATMDFSYATALSSPYLATAFGTGTAFSAEAGSTLIITSAAGIAATGATGNVQLATRTFAGAANYIFRTGPANLITPLAAGSGLPTTVTGSIVVEANPATYPWTFPTSLTITAPGKFQIKQGVVSEDASSGPTITGTGELQMSGGQYQFYRSAAASNILPRLTGTYTLTGGTIELGGNTTGSNTQLLRGGRSYYNVLFSGIANGVNQPSKGITADLIVANNLTLNNNDKLDLSTNQITGAAGLTMSGNASLRLGSTAAAQPSLLATASGQSYSLSGSSTVELYGTSASTQQVLRVADGNANTISYRVLEISAAAANPAGNVDPAGSFALSSQLNVNSPAVLNLDATEAITGAGSFSLLAGAGLRFADPAGIKATGSSASDGHLRISGIRSLSAGADLYIVGGITAMSLGDGLPDSCRTLTLARTGIMSLSRSIKATQGISFSATAGNLVTGTFQAALGYGATLSGETDSHYILGRAATTRLVPIGSTVDFAGLGLQLTATTTAPGYTSVVRTTGSSFLAPTGNNSIKRSFDIRAQVSTGLNVQLDMFYLDSELNGVTELLTSLFRSQNNGATWQAFNAVARNTVTNMVRATNVTGFSIWTIASYDSPLPVKLATFTGRALSPQRARLDWQTASEQSNAGFEIERSEDGKVYSRIGYVPAKTVASTGAAYSFVDPTFEGRAYYRLRQLDLDGTATTSQAIHIMLEAAAAQPKPIFYPSPVGQGRLQLQLGGYEGTISLSLHSADGRQVFTHSGTLQTLNATLPEAVSALPPGTYTAHLTNAQATHHLKLVR